MAPKSEYGSTPDVEKGESTEDKPQKCWCFHATRRTMRTILILIPLLGIWAAEIWWATSAIRTKAYYGDEASLVPLHAFICLYLFVALLVWIPLIWCIIGWAEPFPRYLQYMVLAVFVNLLILYHYDIEHMHGRIKEALCVRHSTTVATRQACDRFTIWFAHKLFLKIVFALQFNHQPTMDDIADDITGLVKSF